MMFYFEKCHIDSVTPVSVSLLIHDTFLHHVIHLANKKAKKSPIRRRLGSQLSFKMVVSSCFVVFMRHAFPGHRLTLGTSA